MLSFTAKIEIIDRNPYVELPKAVLEAIFKQAGKNAGPIPVRGTLAKGSNAAKFQQTLVKYQGLWRLYLNGPMREGAQAKVGDKVKVELAADAKPRTFPMPPAFKKALAKDRKANVIFFAFAPSYQKDINRYLGFSKTKETLDKNIGIVMEYLHGKESHGLKSLLRVKVKKN